jgi:hypothetical protein
MNFSGYWVNDPGKVSTAFGLGFVFGSRFFESLSRLTRMGQPNKEL